MTTDRTRDEALARAVRGAFTDIDRDHSARLARLHGARRLALVCEMAYFARRAGIAPRT